MSVMPDAPIGKCDVAPIVARAARGATGGGARAFEVGMAVKVPMPSTCTRCAQRGWPPGALGPDDSGVNRADNRMIDNLYHTFSTPGNNPVRWG